MGIETRLFKSEERKTKSEVSDFLRQLAEKIDAGQVILQMGTQELTLDLPGNLILEVQVEDEEKGTKGTQHSLEVEIKWYDGDSEGDGSLRLG